MLHLQNQQEAGGVDRPTRLCPPGLDDPSIRRKRDGANAHYFLNMPDRTAKQTICVMPQSAERPTSWDDIKEGRFWIING